jgi:small multidrug resistance pump
MFAFFLLFVSATCSALASVTLKFAGTGTVSHPHIGPLAWKIAAVGFYGVGFMFYAWALKKLPLTSAYPVMVAITIVEVFVFGAWTGEPVTWTNILGALLITAGIIFIVR